MARLARSLEKLRDEIDDLAPRRSRASDGWIGDPAHRARASRHNPNFLRVVTALDVTHDPHNGCDIHRIAETLRVRKLLGVGHPDLEYIVSNGRICSRSSGWRWVTYRGDNPHTKHAHFAVGRGRDGYWVRPPYDSTTSWRIATGVVTARKPRTWRDEVPKPTDVTDVLNAPNGGIWMLTADGGVRAERGAPFHGSYPGLKPQYRRGDRYFVAITRRSDGKPGYTLWANDRTHYTFPAPELMA